MTQENPNKKIDNPSQIFTIINSILHTKIGELLPIFGKTRDPKFRSNERGIKYNHKEPQVRGGNTSAERIRHRPNINLALLVTKHTDSIEDEFLKKRYVEIQSLADNLSEKQVANLYLTSLKVLNFELNYLPPFKSLVYNESMINIGKMLRVEDLLSVIKLDSENIKSYPLLISKLNTDERIKETGGMSNELSKELYDTTSMFTKEFEDFCTHFLGPVICSQAIINSKASAIKSK